MIDRMEAGVNPDEYRSALDRLGIRIGADLCRELQKLGDERSPDTIIRMAQWLRAKRRTKNVPWFMGVIIRLMERERTVQQELDAEMADNEDLRQRLASDRTAHRSAKVAALETEAQALREQVASLARDNDQLNRMLVAAAARDAGDLQRAG